MKPSDISLWRMSTAMAASGLGITLMKIALPTLTGTIGYSATVIGLVTGAITIAWPLFGLVAGWSLDRFGRIAGYRAGTLAAGLAAFTFLIFTETVEQQIALLCILGLLVGLGEVLTETSGQTIVPDLVDKHSLHLGNSMLQGAKMVAATLLAPFLIAQLLAPSPSGVFLLAAAAITVSFFALPKPARNTQSAQRGVQGFFDGARFLLRSPVHRRITMLLMAMSVSWGAWMTLIIPYALSEAHLNIGVPGIGYVMTAMGCGSLIGAIFYQPLRTRLGDFKVRALDPIATLIFIIVPAVGFGLEAVLLSALVAGVGGVTWSISIAAFQQETVPPALLGRTVAAYRWIGWTGFFAGSSVSGLCADISGLQTAFFLFAAPAVLALVTYLFTGFTTLPVQDPGAPSEIAD
ncbi:MFS transporter [Roseibium sp. SCP14]|uniref:MFS transporter n=1 Tax=Roseibium sp. SCP14 TaxID=3141375 RepID=UPI00333CB648